MNADISEERKKATINIGNLINVVDGGKDKTLRRKYLEKLISQDPVFEKFQDLFMNRAQLYELSLKRGLRYEQIQKENNIDDPQDLNILRTIIDSPLPFQLHHRMFIPSIESIGTKSQQEKWIPLAKSYSIVGTYAQTELGHGTNIRSLETTATFDKATQEFVMHSPKLSACKWWPGNLAHSTTHAIVVAQLLVERQPHGIQFFIVQLRDLKDHKPLPGITIGDIGPKASLHFNSNDNGFLLFDHYRIPRENMLMALTKVSPDGKVTKTGNSKVLYGAMMYVRANIPTDMFGKLSKAITIAIRYSSVRRQSELKPGEGEIQVLDFKTQQYKLFPILAASYAFKFASARVLSEYYDLQTDLRSGNDFKLPEMHSITSSLKAFSSDMALQYTQTCRKACGGHGYSMFSGLPELYNSCSAACTYEGENTVLFLQVARYLMKCFNMVSENGKELPPTVAYLSLDDNDKNIPIVFIEQFSNPAMQRNIIEMQSRRALKAVAIKMRSQVKSGMDQMDSWNANSQELVKCAQSHGFVLMVSYFMDFLRVYNANGPIRSVVKSLCDLFVLNGIVENSGSFLETNVLNVNQIGLIKHQVDALINKIRPNAVALVDAFDYSDFTIRSALGKYDGNVYKELFDLAQRSPLNKHQVRPAYEKYLKPLIHNQRSKL